MRYLMSEVGCLNLTTTGHTGGKGNLEKQCVSDLKSLLEQRDYQGKEKILNNQKLLRET